jgi:parallel beta-helix repeat protein
MMSLFRLGLYYAGSAFIAIIACVALSQSSTFSVSPGHTIQDAIDSSLPGDTVEVQPGLYRENVEVAKTITLRGIGYPVIDANDDASAIILSANGIILIGFNATNSSNSGIEVESSDNTLTDNIAFDNDYCGIELKSSCNNTLLKNNLRENGAAGVELDDSLNNTLKGNIAERNGEAGIELEDCGRNRIQENIAINNSNDGIELLASFENVVVQNTASENKDGICLEEKSINNTIKNNSIINNHVDGIQLRDSSGNILERNELVGNSKGIFLEFCTENILKDNNVRGNLNGVHFNYYSTKNKIFYNNLFNNSNFDAYDESSGANQWDDGMVGNHYSDSIMRELDCDDVGDDGICNKSLSIPGGSSMDRYPLITWNTWNENQSEG